MQKLLDFGQAGGVRAYRIKNDLPAPHWPVKSKLCCLVAISKALSSASFINSGLLAQSNVFVAGQHLLQPAENKAEVTGRNEFQLPICTPGHIFYMPTYHSYISCLYDCMVEFQAPVIS